MGTSPQQNCKMSRSPPRLHDELLFDEILTRLPAAVAVRFRAVCRAWNVALTSDHFVSVHAARAAARQPELLFFPPTGGPATSFYACSLPEDGGAPAAARELFTVGNLTGEYVMLSKPCRGLTLVFEVRASEYFVCNLSTGEHVALPPCEPAAKIEHMLFGLPLFQLGMRTWFPFELSSTGLGFDPATGEHKVVRLFMNDVGRQKCEVYAPARSGAGGGWRPCAGNAPPDVASFVVGLPPVALLDGSLYWLLEPSVAGGRFRILSLSVGAEQFGWVRTPPRLIRHLVDLDGSLCAVVHNQLVAVVIELLTWNGAAGPSSSWSTRCRIDLASLPRAMSGELSGRREVVPLCSSGAGGKKILLATSRHRVYAYDVEDGGVEKVFSMQDYVDVPRHHIDARLLVNIGLHEERIAGFRGEAAGGRRLQVKLGGDTVGKRETSSEVYLEHEEDDDDDRKLKELFMHIAFPNHHQM